MQARYYAPRLGRFVSRDPIGFAGGINLYAYCGGDPVNYGDPSGTVTSINWDGHPIFSFDAQWALAGLKTGGEALRYAFTLSLWKPDKECESAPGWEAAEGPAWLAAGSSYTALAIAAAPAMESLAPAVTRLLNPITVAPLATLAAQDAENPAAEEETIDELGNNCLGAVEEVLQNAEERITVSRWGRPGLQPDDWVMKGNANYWNYFLSFKYQRGWGNEFAPFSSGEEFQVPASSVKWPNGRGIDSAWKGLFGQRMYIP